MVHRGPRMIAGFSGLVLGAWLAACSGDNGGVPPETTGGGGETTPATRLVYLADQEIDGVYEIYEAGSGIKLNPSLSAGRQVFDDYQILPDRSGVVYRAVQDNDNLTNLYLAKFDEPGVSIKLNPSLTGAQDVIGFSFVPDGSGVVYRADQQTDDVFELYWVRFSNPGTSTKLNGPLVAGGDVSMFVALPDSTGVVYVADQNIDQKDELFLVSFTAQPTSQKLNSPLADDKGVYGPQVLPDSRGVVYLAKETSLSSYELYRVLFNAPGSSTKLNGRFASSSYDYVLAPAVTPDGSGVVFLGPGDPGLGHEIYRVTFAKPGVNVKLNSPLAAGLTAVISFELLPDSTGLIYFTNQDMGDGIDLYRANFATPGTSVKVSGSPFDPDRVVRPRFTVTPDSQSVVYVVVTSFPRTELWYVDLEMPGLATLLKGPPLTFFYDQLGPVLSVRMEVTPDSKGLLYVGSETAGVDELFQVNFATPATAVKQNGALVTNGNVKNFAVR